MRRERSTTIYAESQDEFLKVNYFLTKDLGK